MKFAECTYFFVEMITELLRCQTSAVACWAETAYRIRIVDLYAVANEIFEVFAVCKAFVYSE